MTYAFYVTPLHFIHTMRLFAMNTIRLFCRQLFTSENFFEFVIVFEIFHCFFSWKLLGSFAQLHLLVDLRRNAWPLFKDIWLFVDI